MGPLQLSIRLAITPADGPPRGTTEIRPPGAQRSATGPEAATCPPLAFAQSYGPVVISGYPWSVRLKALLPSLDALGPEALSRERGSRPPPPRASSGRGAESTSRTWPETLLKHHLPIQTALWSERVAGFAEVDLGLVRPAPDSVHPQSPLYKKDDNTHTEQKSRTHVPKPLGLGPRLRRRSSSTWTRRMIRCTGIRKDDSSTATTAALNRSYVFAAVYSPLGFSCAGESIAE
jgi:hypothetical protein